MPVKILADSAADLTKEIIKQHNITVVPLVILSDSHEYLDGIDISPKKVFDEMRAGKIFTTAQVPVSKFLEIFTEMAKNNEECFYPAFSSQLSGTYNAAVTALQEVKQTYPDVKIEIIDTLCASVGLGHVVEKAAELAERGMSAKEMVPFMTAYAHEMVHVFSVEKLESLYRGGRVSKAAAFIGDTLGIRPILTVIDGKLIPVQKIRGEKKLFQAMLDLIEEKAGNDLTHKLISVMHADNLEGAKKLKALLEARFGCKNIRFMWLGAMIGAHAGPGTLSIFVEGKNAPQLP